MSEQLLSKKVDMGLITAFSIFFVLLYSVMSKEVKIKFDPHTLKWYSSVSKVDKNNPSHALLN